MVLHREWEGKGVAGVVECAGLCCAVGGEEVGEPAHGQSVSRAPGRARQNTVVLCNTPIFTLSEIRTVPAPPAPGNHTLFSPSPLPQSHPQPGQSVPAPQPPGQR